MIARTIAAAMLLQTSVALDLLSVACVWLARRVDGAPPLKRVRNIMVASWPEPRATWDANGEWN